MQFITTQDHWVLAPRVDVIFDEIIFMKGVLTEAQILKWTEAKVIMKWSNTWDAARADSSSLR